MLDQVLSSGSLSVAGCASLRSCRLYLSHVYPARVGRGQVAPFGAHMAEGGGRVSVRFLEALRLHRGLLSLAPVRRVDLTLGARPRAVLYTDACCAPGGDGLPCLKLCCIILRNDTGARFGFTFTVPSAMVMHFDAKDTYIGHGEALAPLLAFSLAREHLQGCSIVGLIDNIGVLGAFTKGASSVGHFDPIVHFVNLSVAFLECSVWRERVDSHANIADGGSRVGASDPVARAAGIQLSEVSDVWWPVDLRSVQADAWINFLRSGDLGMSKNDRLRATRLQMCLSVSCICCVLSVPVGT